MKDLYKNTIVKMGAVLLIFTTIISCSDLDLQPISEVPIDGFYTNETEVETAVAGVYDGLQKMYSREYGEPGGLWSLTDLRSDDMTIILSEGEWGRVEGLNMTSNSDITLDFWRASYLTIGRANTLLENLDVITDANLKNQYEGEGKFARALTLFNLVRLFGEVPLTNSATASPSELPDLTRRPVSEVYDQIVSDFTDAMTKLPATNAVGRATSGAAKGMLAKVYLTLNNTGQAKTLLEDVMNDGYTLEPSVGSVFSISNESNNEILYSVGYKTSSNSEGNTFSYDFTDNTLGYIPTKEQMNNSPAGSRYDATLAVVGVEDRCIKYDPSSASQEEGENDWIVLRFADIVLMYAEIVNLDNGDGNMQPAIDELNKVHAREDLAPYVLSDFANSAELADAIKDERRYEFVYEGIRWFDLQRYGTLTAVMSAHLGKTIPATAALLPIPQREIDVSQGVITQNPGY